MTTEVTTQTQAPEAPKAPTISDANLSFTDYERLRRGESLPTVEASTPSAPGEAKASPDQKSSSDSESEETDTQGEVESEAEGDEHEAKDDAKPDEDKPKVKKSGYQRRVDKLNGRIASAQQEAEYWKGVALKGASAKSDEAPTVEAAKPASASAEAEPDPDKFETHSEYVKAVAKWEAKQLLAEERQAAQKASLQAEQSKVKQTYVERVKAFSAKTPDFAEVMADADDVPMSPTIEQVVISSENGPAIAYELAKNPDEARRIAKLPPLQAALELGKVESRIASRESQQKKTETKKLTQAPKPIEPVAGTKSAGAQKSPEEMSFSEYEKYRREQMRRRRA